MASARSQRRPPAAAIVPVDLPRQGGDDARTCFRFHAGQLDQQLYPRVNLSEELRAGIGRGELDLKYQPQVEIGSGRIVGLEALVRWNHPTRGDIRPSVFVSIAERTGVIQGLGTWVLHRACRQLREWDDAGLVVPRLAINVSGAQLRRSGEFQRDAAEAFARWGVRRNAIELELTETVLMEVSKRQSDAIERLRELGATIAIDDFGTGYSSLTYLTAYPVNKLKIAQELVAGIVTDSRSAVVVRSAVRLAHELDMECIAEGVEQAEQARLLTEFGCKYAQGYLYSRPMPATDVARLLAATAGVSASAAPSQEVGAS